MTSSPRFVSCALGAWLLTSTAAAQPSRSAAVPPPPTAPLALSAPESDRVVDQARFLFPQTQGWFRLVAGAVFIAGYDGRLVPDYNSLTHPRVRRADNAGYTILPRYPLRFDGWMRIASGQHPDAWVELRPLDARGSVASQQDGVLVYPDAYVDTDVIYKSTPTHADEYLLVRSRAAPTEWTYRLRRGPRITAIRQTGTAIEAVDSQGRAWLRAGRPIAVDRSGHRVTGEVVVRDNTLVVRIDLSTLEMPALVDPDWTSTADMSYGRFYAAANVLPSGRVLATGGCSASVCSGDLTLPACRTVLRESETLDLGSRTWSRAGDDTVGRFFHSAESLESGAVLVAGGCTDPACASTTPSVTVYDPASSSFGAVGSLAEGRAGIASIRLRDGRVLLAGGCTGATCSTRVELYDPRTRTLTPGAPMATARGRAEVVLLRDGRALVTGGCTSIQCAGVLASAEVYDPTADRWTSATPMATPRGGHFAALLDDGRVLIGGGCPDGACTSFLRSTEIYDPAMARFAPGPSMMQMRLGAEAVRMPDGRVLINQGCSGRTDCDLSNEVFNPRTSSFARIEDAVTSRAFHSFVLHERSHMAVAIGGCQPRTCSWWNETYDLSNIHPVEDAGVDAGASDVPSDASSDVPRSDAGPRPDVTDAATPDAPAPLDGATLPPPPGARSNACGCVVVGNAGSGLLGKVALAALGLAVTARRRRRRGAR